MYGHDALQSSNMFYLNNSNPMFAIMTSSRPDFEHFETPPAMKGLNDAIMKRLDINMSDPKIAKDIFDTPLKDVIKGGKDMINGEEGQWKIANGMADFINEMAMQMSRKMPPQPSAGGPSPDAAPHAPARRATPGEALVPNQAAVPLQPPVLSQPPIFSPQAPQTPTLNVKGPGTPSNSSSICPKNCVPAPAKNDRSKNDGQPFGPPKPKPTIPPPGEWASGSFTPLENAIKEHGPTISSGIKHGAIKAMNAQTESLRKTIPIYDFYNIYYTGVCWGFYKPTGPQTIGCGSSAEWKNIDLTPRIQTMLNNFVSPSAKIAGPIGLGHNMERFLATTRILLFIMYINKVMTVVNQAFAMLIPIAGMAAMFGGMLPDRLHLKLSFANFATSAAAAGAVVGGTMSLLGMMLGMGLTMPPMNAMMSIDMRLGIPYVLLCLVDSIFAVVGTVCWWKVWRGMVNGAKQRVEQEGESFEREHGKIEVVEVIRVEPNKEYGYDSSWVRG